MCVCARRKIFSKNIFFENKKVIHKIFSFLIVRTHTTLDNVCRSRVTQRGRVTRFSLIVKIARTARVARSIVDEKTTKLAKRGARDTNTNMVVKKKAAKKTVKKVAKKAVKKTVKKAVKKTVKKVAKKKVAKRK